MTTEQTTDPYAVTATEANYTNHDPMVWYPGTIVDVETDDGQYGEQFKFSIDTGVLDNEGNPRYDLLWTSKTFTPGSKLGRMAKALKGPQVLEPGTQFNVRDLVGLGVEVMFEHYEAESEGKKVQREKILFTNSGVGIRPRTTEAQAAPAAAPAADDLANAPVAPAVDDDAPF